MSALTHSFCIAGTQSGSGKTTLSLGLMAALKKRGLTVQPFKCGPDYIDAGFHHQAAGRRSRNLDSWMMPAASISTYFNNACNGADVAICEGVMGLFDGASASELTGSTAEIAQLTEMPVVLVVDARAMARSVAALVSGFANFEAGVSICAVIANRVGSERHAQLIRDALDAAGLPPLIGTLPRDASFTMPERHLGLQAHTELEQQAERLEALGAAVEAQVDIDRLLKLTTRPMTAAAAIPSQAQQPTRVRLGLARDEAFYFYYEDNLDLLRSEGAELIEFSPLHDAQLPDGLDGVYIGGGFPEEFAAQLAENHSMRESLSRYAAEGGSIYAECGGFMYLCEEITFSDGRVFPMSGVLQATCQMRDKRQRLGYTEATTLNDGLFGPAGTRLRGHEFHWSEVVAGKDAQPLFAVTDASGQRNECIGIQSGKVYASYFHPHFASNPGTVKAWLSQLSKHG
ncbi:MULTISPECIES: cobyrinate a,c-diamide synthase [unclassified Lentimonas]|uniref:cobyrinate a,c-diamide synthase n=1 Tax=unclassified Lentimonas TaxID=2630993 RepID=UPI0013261766|nr:MULTISPECIES: cobyrinate a,c-diamide synthase [unclassified Lentimonas]CAA6679501.1 Cobyrinic acid A,C-diamide synthase [Lentimonas sp. CC4]CAA6687172.1 Cobyrinic acid A,C-diamide synthase [Lentimonas sp. CC6]CAA7075481.1 Cobyrinic acid A,C-diamide synthase [Lentimonas sp. CC4]CAA7170248.1 Cobyrinic acid A,C-diamide synthase [Lentimonas sp. CC21]CAA7182542.1 Cobyrinic acid A,C-diamide synthase [Lentimonas sp. CC8]